MAPTPALLRGLLVAGAPSASTPSSVIDLTVPAVLLRAMHRSWPEIVNVYRVQVPTVAFSARDIRSPGILAASRAARTAGFETVVRSPGGRMVAYDAGAVVIDHVTRSDGIGRAGPSIFAANAASHLQVLHALGVVDARVGEVEGEYCPGEFSINIAGIAKVIGSAQRLATRASLFSTVVQVEMSERVRDIMEAVSAALGYRLRRSSVAGLTDSAPNLTPDTVVKAFLEDYRSRLSLVDGPLPAGVAVHVAHALDDQPGDSDLPFRVDDWARARPLRLTGAS